MYRFLLVLLLLSPLAANADSRAIDLRNDYEDSMSRYRTNSTRENKCLAFRNARNQAQSLMRYHQDSSLAIRWNSMLPSTRCKQARLIIDPAATKTSEKPELNQVNDGFTGVTGGLAGGGCLPFHKILELEWKRSIKAQCPGGGFISIKAH